MTKSGHFISWVCFRYSSIVVLLFCWHSAFAQIGTYPSSCIPRDFDAADFTPINDASYTTNGVFEITPAAGSQTGSVWYSRRLDLRVNFRIDVDLYLGANPAGADGIAFVLQNLDTGQGSTGGGLGYGGGAPIRPSMAIEFDTWYNFPWDPVGGADHIGFVENGNSNIAIPSQDVIETIDLEDGNFHNVIIQWDPVTEVFEYTFTHANGTVYADQKTVDLIALIGNNIAFWGFTGSTGGANNQQMVRFDNNSICVVDATFPVILGNNYATTSASNTLAAEDLSYFCGQIRNGFFNLAYHNGENYQPRVGDYILYNNYFAAPQQLFVGNDIAYFKMQDFNQIIEVRKSDGLILNVYNCP